MCLCVYFSFAYKTDGTKLTPIRALGTLADGKNEEFSNGFSHR
jgi:hypothetical protein